MSNRGINKVILVGYLGRNPETKYTQNSSPVTNITIATSESWQDKKTKETREHTEWHRVVIFGKLAEIAKSYLRKGSQVYIEGQLRTRKWNDQSGVEKYTTEVILGINGTFRMLGSRPKNISEDNRQLKKIDGLSDEFRQKHQEDNSHENELDFEDDIPF